VRVTLPLIKNIFSARKFLIICFQVKSLGLAAGLAVATQNTSAQRPEP